MDRMKKRTLCLLLAACMLLGLLAGCGKKNNAQQLSATVYVPQYLDLNLDLEYVRGGCCDGENLYVIGQIGHDATETDPDTGETYTSRTYTYDIFRISLADGASEKLSGYTAPAVPEGREGRASIERLETGKDGTLWVTEYLYLWGNRDQEKYPDIAVDAIGGIAIDSEVSVMARSAAEAEPLPGPGYTEVEATPDTPAGEVYEDQEIITRRQLDAQGNELDRIDISNLDEALAGILGEDEYISNHTFDSEGNLYVVTASKIYALDPQMNILFSVEGKDMWSEPIQLGGGLMGMQVWEDDETSETSTNKLRTIDPAKQDWGPEYILSSNVYDLSPGGGDYLCYYQLNDSIFGFKAAADDSAAGEGERLFSWIEADIDYSDVNGFYFLPDGRVAALLMEWPEDGKGSNAKISVVILTATPREELPEKTTLIYASLYLSYDARRKILDFNKRSDQYRIEVRDYAEYDTDGKGQMALQKLNTEILAGNVPDILDTNNLPLRQYGAKGILEDLWPFIDSDPDLGRDALMVRPLEANAQDGKLYEIFSSFSIQTAAGPSKIVGDSLSWTLADLQAALEKMPEGCSIMGQDDTQESMLRLLMSLNMDQFVDWTTGKCSFDSEDFKAMLEFCRSFPVEWDWEKQGEDYEDANSRIMNGRQLLSTMNVSDFTWSVQSPAAVFNNEFTFVGFPRENGSAGSYFSFYRGLAMTSSCADKEGAWSFIRQTLLPQVENGRYYGNFPINKADFDKVVRQSMEIEYETDENGKPVLDEDGNKIPVYMGDIWVTNDLQVPSRAATQEDVDKVMELYNAVDSMYAYDEKIFDAVKEVASQYFAGDKPLDDTASLIQSKVSLYVNESR
ncbi:MAG: extracellular solute-binding protein [Oscillospiraceae bacterium]|jgi:ABC-type glycerol-3-phosphate transport system substrate-binding protein|nr:extracellular solute-binding protein [Oscillospiraceae bacterium]